MAARIEIRSPHLHEPSLQAFLEPDFDPAEYLNATLPALSSSATRTNASVRSVPLSELNTQLQNLLNTLNAQTTRLSNALTQLTDEIVRIGGRLAYEVEVLRGETNSLNDTLTSTLKQDLDIFVAPAPDSLDAGSDLPDSLSNAEPEYLRGLQTLATVRSRLDSVIKVFGDAMSWPIAPSEVSTTASLISVSAPNTDDARAREAKGHEYVESLREEIRSLLLSGTEGVEAASTRIVALRGLVEVWKGTAEEKPRSRMVEALQKTVEEERGKAGAGGDRRADGALPAASMEYRYGDLSATSDVAKESSGSAVAGGGYGFLQNLRNLKNDMYLD